MTTIEAVAGQTAPIYLYLKIDGATPTNPDGSALTMAGMTCALIMTNLAGTSRSIAGTVTVQDASAWLVKYSPAAGDLAAGQWRARVQVTDTGSKIGYFPSGEPDFWVIR